MINWILKARLEQNCTVLLLCLLTISDKTEIMLSYLGDQTKVFNIMHFEDIDKSKFFKVIEANIIR